MATPEVPENENKDREEFEAMEFASAVLTGTAVGRSLDRALQSLVSEDSAAARSLATQDDTDDGNNSDTSAPVREIRTHDNTVVMNAGAADEILRAFRDEIAASGLRHNSDKDGAPRALMRGRCDHYNRFGSNWMVAMDSIKFKARPTKFTKRRRDDRPSLWDRDDDEGEPEDKEIALGGTVQLLAYGDIE